MIVIKVVLIVICCNGCSIEDSIVVRWMGFLESWL